jgi:hypothetical protein
MYGVVIYRIALVVAVWAPVVVMLALAVHFQNGVIGIICIIFAMMALGVTIHVLVPPTTTLPSSALHDETACPSECEEDGVA